MHEPVVTTRHVGNVKKLLSVIQAVHGYRVGGFHLASVSVCRVVTISSQYSVTSLVWLVWELMANGGVLREGRGDHWNIFLVLCLLISFMIVNKSAISNISILIVSYICDMYHYRGYLCKLQYSCFI